MATVRRKANRQAPRDSGSEPRPRGSGGSCEPPPPLAGARGSDSAPRTPNPEPRLPSPAVPLYPYQQRWLRDGARFKLAVKATQIGYSFAAALEAVLDCLERRTLWIVLSRGERQSLEFMQKVCDHARVLGIVESTLETDFFERTSIQRHEVKFPNGSRIIGLPANPDTARGYTGNMILDEFAFHRDDREIWAAAFGRVSRGALKLRVLSTPNGQRGKYYELAKQCGLTVAPSRDRSPDLSLPGAGRNACPTSGSVWSSHWCDVYTAVREGCPIDVEMLRQAIGDAATWQQEYECAFLAASDQYIPLELIVAAEHPEASVALPAGWDRNSQDREFFFGYDVARVNDLAVVAILERLGDVYWTRALIEMAGLKFSDQEKVLGDVISFCRRGAVDATGMGAEMAERLAAKFPGQVEPVDFTAPRKQEMTVRVKRHLEDRALRIPDYRPLRRDLGAVKRITTSAGNIRFDAERTEEGHADRFWALALALHAAGRAPAAIAAGSLDGDDGWHRSDAMALSSRGVPSLSRGDEGPAFSSTFSTPRGLA